MARPSGMPMITAIEVPVTTTLSARERREGGTVCTAMEGMMDQNMAWVPATPMRASISIQYDEDRKDNPWKRVKQPITPSRSLRISILENSMVRGRERSITIQAYTEMRSPTVASVR